MREAVLVVEDEFLLRMTAADLLEDAGFEVIEAANSTEAMAILEARKDIHLVFTDIDMPDGVDGLKLAALIRDRWPPVEIIITSGNKKPDFDALPARCVFYSKPYDMDRVIRTLHGFSPRMPGCPN